MYTLQKLNVVKKVATEAKKDELISLGFALIDEQEATQIQKEKPLNKMNLDELKEYAASKEIDIEGSETKLAILAKIKEVEQGK